MPRDEPKGSFVRWQSITIAQLTYSVNLILGLAVAALGFQVALLLNDKFNPIAWQKCAFSVSMFLLVLSIALGIWCVVNRLRDFRATTKAARMREQGKPAEDIQPYRDLYKKLGKKTWCLFWWQIGTFQYPNRFDSENPLDEVWSHIARYGTKDYLKNYTYSDKSGINWDKYINYAIVRAKQAVEFRKSAIKSTLLTKPLALYYSFLNLTRALLALGPEVIPSSAHGLKFVKGDNLFTSGAKLTKGTFTDYLSAFGYKWEKGTIVSLEDAFARIIEIHQDFISLKKYDSYVFPVRIKVNIGGPIYIDPILPHKEFPKNWENEFPALKDKCTIEEDGQGFIVNDKEVCESHGSISKYLHQVLHHDLIYNHMNSAWYLIREVDTSLSFSRASYYYIAVFILGSIVRYEPELMLEVSQSESETGWFINRLLNKAERFFPQLKISEQAKTTIYF